MIVVALPDMARELQASAHAVSYVISGLLFGLVATLVSASWLGQRLGFSRLFLTGTYLALLATIACGASPSLSVLIVSRMVQGIGIGAIVASSYALLALRVSAKRLGWAFGLLSTGAGVGMILGLPVGGLITSYFDWRWLFFGTVPFLLALTLFAHKSLPPHQRVPQPQNVRVTLKDILKIPNFFAGLLMLFIFQGVMGGLRFLTPFLLENQTGTAPAASGFIFLSYPLGFLLLSVWSGRKADTYSPKRLMLFAAGVSLSVCLLYLLLIDTWGVWHFSVFLLLLGAATGLFTPPNNVAILRGLSEAEIQVASTLIPISLNASLMFGTFSFGLIFKEHDPSLVLMTSIAAFAGIVLLTILRSS